VTITPALSDLGDEDFVELTTFRTSGTAVPTTVWVVRDGDTLVVTTPSGSGKVKRLRRNPDVQLRASSRRGRVEPGAPMVAGSAVLDPDPRAHDGVAHLFEAKYGWQYRTAMVVERVIRRFRPRPGPDRRIVRITDGQP
jgi:PPOX class probable F420-dependent enzyme